MQINRSAGINWLKYGYFKNLKLLINSKILLFIAFPSSSKVHTQVIEINEIL